MDQTRSQPQNTSVADRPALQAVFEAIFESLPMAVVVFDRRLEIVVRNEAAKALIPEGPDLSAALAGLTVESRYEDWAAELRKVMETDLARRIDVTLPRGEDQAEVFLNMLISPLRRDRGGETIGGLLMAEDVTANIGMQRRLAVSERLAAVGKLAARVAHELNNPLDGILRYTNLALRLAAEGGDSKLVGFLENARTGMLRMSEIIRDLLDFSRSTPSTFQQATLNKIVEDAVSALDGRAQEANITVVCNFHQTDMPVVRGSNLFQVFCNLIKNAIDAMPNGGTVTLTTRIITDDIVVTIADTGIGLPRQADRIFEAFFTTKPPGQGTGLGLAVCKELIEKYSGTITAEPNTPRGTLVTVRIPVISCTSLVGGRLRGRAASDSGAEPQKTLHS